MQANPEVYSIYFDEELEAVVMEWDGYATSQQFREGTELMLNTLIRHKAKKVLADIKDMIIIGQDDQQWLTAHFIPRAIEFGFRYIALLRPRHYFNQVAVETISYKVDIDKLTIHFFEEVDEAREWLQEIE